MANNNDEIKILVDKIEQQAKLIQQHERFLDELEVFLLTDIKQFNILENCWIGSELERSRSRAVCEAAMGLKTIMTKYQNLMAIKYYIPNKWFWFRIKVKRFFNKKKK